MQYVCLGVVFVGLLILACSSVIREYLYSPLIGMSWWARKPIERAQFMNLIPETLYRKQAKSLVTGEMLSLILNEAYRYLAVDFKASGRFSGVITGISHDDCATRANLATAIAGLAELFGITLDGEFYCIEDVLGHPAEEEIEMVVATEIMRVRRNGEFGPDDELTLEQAIVATVRLIDYAFFDEHS